MITRQQLLKNREMLTDKAIGALCGLAIGDSFGDAARMPENQRDYGFTTDFNKGASWNTDDTEFVLLVAETIISKGRDFTSEDVAGMWLQHVATEDELKRGGVSEAVAVAVSLAMVDASMDEIWEAVLETDPEGSWFRETLPEVFECLRFENSSFKSRLLLAANFGRDADTIGAVAGAVMGAPVEPTIWTYERIRDTYGDITGYVKEYKNFAADDDANGPVYFLRALRDDARDRELTPQDVANAWLNYAREGMGMFWWGGYGVSTEHRHI